MVTIYLILTAAASFIISVFFAHASGKASGKKSEIEDQEKKASKEKIENLESERGAKLESEKKSKIINDEIDSYNSGDAAKWLRENANRDSDGQ